MENVYVFTIGLGARRETNKPSLQTCLLRASLFFGIFPILLNIMQTALYAAVPYTYTYTHAPVYLLVFFIGIFKMYSSLRFSFLFFRPGFMYSAGGFISFIEHRNKFPKIHYTITVTWSMRLNKVH